MHKALLRECATCFYEKPVQSTAKMSMSIGVAAVLAALLVGGIALASTMGEKDSGAGGRSLSLSTAQAGQSFTVRPGTLVTVSLPEGSWTPSLAERDFIGSPSVQFGADAGPYTLSGGGQTFVAHAMYAGTTVMTFTRGDNTVVTFTIHVAAPGR